MLVHRLNELSVSLSYFPRVERRLLFRKGRVVDLITCILKVSLRGQLFHDHVVLVAREHPSVLVAIYLHFYYII